MIVRRDVVRHYQLSVLLCSHSKVSELTVLLIELLEGTLCFHYKITDQGTVLDSRKVLREVLHGDAVEVDQHVADGSGLLHQVVQGLLHFSLFSSGLEKYSQLSVSQKSQTSD